MEEADPSNLLKTLDTSISISRVTLNDTNIAVFNGNDSESSKITTEIFKLQTGEATDIILNVGNKKFACHKKVLTGKSPCFQAMFASGMRESQAECVTLSEANSESFQFLLQYLYSGELPLSTSNIQGITLVSSLYQVSDALKLCSDYLISIIDDETCLGLLQMADFLMLKDVYNHARKHALWHFKIVSHLEEFYNASSAQVIDYLQDEFLNCDSEVEVFEAAALWYHAQDKPCEVSNIAIFFADAVNFHLMSEEELATLTHLSIVQKEKELKQFVSTLKHEDIMENLKMKHASRCRSSPRNGMILCVGAHQCSLLGCKEDCLISQWSTAPLEILQFQPVDCTLVPFADMSHIYPALSFDSGYRVCSMGHLVYVCGGEATLGRNAWLNTVWCLNTLHGTWHEAGQLTQPRRHHGICSHDTSLFLIGGIGRYRVRLQSVESFNTLTGEWHHHPDMLQAETSPAVAVFDGRLYVFKNCPQMYDINLQSWSYLELSPSVPGLPVYAHVDTDGKSIFVSCFNSETLWQVDLERRKCLRVCDFSKEGGGCIHHHNRLFHFQLGERHGGEVCVECYDLEERRQRMTGQLQRTVLTSHFVTVPCFPQYLPSTGH